jgi:hypothetical protein
MERSVPAGPTQHELIAIDAQGEAGTKGSVQDTT